MIDMSKFIIFEHGKNSYFNIVNNKIIEKFFMGTEQEIKLKIDIIKPLISICYDDINAFPLNIINDNDGHKGYSCNYYKNSFLPLEYNISYDMKYNTIINTVKQLKFLHKMGYIVNDVRLSNYLLIKEYNTGTLIDFEDMIFEDDDIIKPSYYRFYKKGTYDRLSPSKLEDCKKQFICSLSLLLDQDFEMKVICSDEWDLLQKFSFKKELYDFMEILFKGKELLYFDEIMSLFTEKDIVEYQKRLTK